MRRCAVSPKRTDLVDTAGTGGDGQATINISTAAALVAAAAGAGVAKHGNRAVSSASGSADVLEALGFTLDPPPERIADSIDELGFGFLFAPTHHPGFRHAAPVRKELATRTVFNVLGPLCNPAGARAQVVGVYEPALVRTIAEVLSRLGSRRAFVVHGAFGIDELSPAGPNFVCEVVEGEVIERQIDPRDYGIAPSAPEELRGGIARAECGSDPRRLLRKERGAKRDAILLNAAGRDRRGRATRRTCARPRGRTRDGRSERPRSGSRSWSRFSTWLGSATRSPGPGSRRSPSSSGGRPRWATSGPARGSPRSSPPTPRTARARSRCSSTSASPGRSRISAPRAPRPTVPLLGQGLLLDRGAPARAAARRARTPRC